MRHWAIRFASCVAFALAPLAAALADPSGTTANWPGHGGDTQETSFSALGEISTGNVAKLGLAWSLDLPGEQMLEGTPIEIDGVLYFTGSYAAVYAVDALTGKLLWKYDPEIWKHGPQKLRYALPCNRGVAYAAGRVFVATIDGRLIALDAKSGGVLWSVETTPAASFQTITGAPRVFNGKVIIGNGGADFGARGYVTAYDTATGRQVWRFYMAPGSPDENRGDPAMEQAAATWHGQYWKTGTGGGPWDSMTFDKELNHVYVGTGNAAPYDPDARSPGGGDNLFTASIVALDADTGKLVWYYQVNPRDSWDFDSTQQMSLADLVIGGQHRKVLMQAPKNGFLYVIDRSTGKLISAAKIAKANWASGIDVASGRPIEAKDIHYETGGMTIWPSAAGAHSWQTMSFDPKTGLVYIPTQQSGMKLARLGPGAGFGGVAMAVIKMDPGDLKGSLVAWDPVQQSLRWKVPHNFFWNGGVLSTAGGLVFQGDADGYLTAYDAENGHDLWRFNAGLGIISAPISYSINGKQYVSLLVGYGGTNAAGEVMNAGWRFDAQPRRLLTFALDGKAVLPPSTPPDLTVHPVDNPAIKISKADVAAGQGLFAMNCANCHGLNVDLAGAPAPDLRELQAAVDRKSLWTIVHGGVLLPQGMPRFDKLSAKDVHEIYAYIRARTRETLAMQAHPAPKGP